MKLEISLCILSIIHESPSTRHSTKSGISLIWPSPVCGIRSGRLMLSCSLLVIGLAEEPIQYRFLKSVQRWLSCWGVFHSLDLLDGRGQHGWTVRWYLS
jgi:hypothetical protein